MEGAKRNLIGPPSLLSLGAHSLYGFLFFHIHNHTPSCCNTCKCEKDIFILPLLLHWRCNLVFIYPYWCDDMCSKKCLLSSSLCDNRIINRKRITIFAWDNIKEIRGLQFPWVTCRHKMVILSFSKIVCSSCMKLIRILIV